MSPTAANDRPGHLTRACLFQDLMMPEEKCLFWNHYTFVLRYEFQYHWMKANTKFTNCQTFSFSTYLITKFIHKSCINLVEIFVAENISRFIFITQLHLSIRIE